MSVAFPVIAWVVVSGGLLLLGPLPAQARAEDGPAPFSAAPADCIAAFYSTGHKDSTALHGFLATTSLLVEAARTTGMLANLDPKTAFWIDMAASIPLVFQQAHTVALMSITARQRPGRGHRLSGLQLGVVLDTKGANEAIKNRIRRLLLTHTGTDNTRLVEETKGGVSRFTLRDRRLPDWASVTWGAVGNRYVMALGDGAFDRIVAAVLDGKLSLATDSWVEEASALLDRSGRGMSFYLDFQRLYPRDDPVLADKIRGVQKSLGLPGVRKCLFGLGHERRSIQVEGVVLRNGQNRTHAIAHSRFLADLPDRVVPDAATGFAVFRCNPSALLDTVSTGYLTARSPKGRAGAIQYWQTMQQRSGIDVAGDLVAFLGNHVVIHNYPRHALGIPLAVTIVIPVAGDATALRRNVDKLMTFLQKELSEGSAVKVRRTDEGVWFLDFGIQGPAMTVTDGWLIISFSPQAVLENVKKMASKGQG